MQEHFEKVIGRLRTLEGLIERLQTVEGGGPATQIDETAGPTTLDIGAIADGEHLRRSGTNIVGHNVLTSGGWLEIPDGSWSYASATTIMVPSGAASIYAAGDQVRLKQGGAYKYFYVIAIADTTLTVTGGSDYSVANAAITDAAFSKGGGVGHPGWYNWTPTYTGFSADPSGTLIFAITPQKTCKAFVTLTNLGTSNANNFQITSPVTATAHVMNALSYIVNGGVGSISEGYAQIVSNNVIRLATAGGTAAWTTSGSKGARFQIEFPI